MAITTTDFMTALGIRLSQTINTSSDPSTTKVYQVISETADWITKLCAEYESDLSRKIGTLTLADGTATYRDFCHDMFIPAQAGWIEETYARDRKPLSCQDDIMDYSPDSGAETEPDRYYLGPNGEITFLQTPDDTYTAKIPYYYHQTKITALTYTMNNATQANPCVVTTTAAHGFQTGDRTYIESVVGMTQLNELWYTVTRASSTTFSLDGVNSTAYTAYGSAGTAHTVIPFNGVFDSEFIEFVSMRFQNINDPNRPTYQMEFETSWLKFLLESARKVILQRKTLLKKITR